MWKCPVCEEYSEGTRCECGFDPSTDYESWPTLCVPDGMAADSIARRRSKLKSRQYGFHRCECGSRAFGFHLESRQFRCLECDALLDPEGIPPVIRQESPAADTRNPPILGYLDYLKKLKQLFLDNDQKLLTDKQLADFLEVHDLSRRFGIHLQDAQQDLQKIARKYAVEIEVPEEERITTYQGYLDALEKMYLENDRRPLSRGEISEFLDEHRLKQRFQIRVGEAMEDLKKIQSKYPPSPRPKQIRSYLDYLEALNRLYLENDGQELTQEQITDFLAQYDLSRRFGIRLQDAQQDLKKTAKTK